MGFVIRRTTDHRYYYGVDARTQQAFWTYFPWKAWSGGAAVDVARALRDEGYSVVIEEKRGR